MNYLAHAYLSKSGNAELLMGNMMGDFVKGKQYLQYPEHIQKGILLHRAIDTFTDAHPAVSTAKKLFSPYYGHYSGVLVDVLWDYYLANDTSIFSTHELLGAYTQKVYGTLNDYEALMPERMAHMCGYMIEYDWLYNYRTIDGIASSWRGMAKRITHLAPADKAVEIWEAQSEPLRLLYQQLIADMTAQFIKS